MMGATAVIDMPGVVSLVGTKEAAALLGVSQRRVQAMIDQGHFRTAQKIGPGWVIERAEVEELAQRKRAPGRPKQKPS